ncbi:MAG: DUF1109 family protein [Chitinophagia bacterium]|nr:DUF1109 family protein [Chitinophagia bacterium]
MNNTDDLIVRLSKEASAVQPVRMSVWGGVIVSVLLVYGIGAQVYLGIRPDILSSLMKLAYVIEIILLAALALSGAFASIHALYPDMYQRSWVAKLPFFILGILSLFLVYQGLMDNPSMDMAFLLHEIFSGIGAGLGKLLLRW